jgi:hypothetical protein
MLSPNPNSPDYIDNGIAHTARNFLDVGNLRLNAAKTQSNVENMEQYIRALEQSILSLAEENGALSARLNDFEVRLCNLELNDEMSKLPVIEEGSPEPEAKEALGKKKNKD